MCGIAGIIHRNAQTADIGKEMVAMLASLKHRGPDSTGFALYGESDDAGSNRFTIRCKFAEQEDMKRGFHIQKEIQATVDEVDARLAKMNVKVHKKTADTDYAYRYEIEYDGDMQHLSDFLEDIEAVEILSIGHALELIKDLGDAHDVSGLYDLEAYRGTHAIGHTRMATESDVDIRSAHPYWAYPFSDISVVHNGQLTNYWTMRRAMERKGHRFNSNCDSELIAVYIADAMQEGKELEASMHESIDDLDGVFTYIVATQNQLGMAKDVMAAKPMVLFESDDLVAMASEEVAIHKMIGHQSYTYDPYEGEVKVWSR